MSLEEFYKEAPPEISRPAITLTEPHQQTLARLDWELEQRKRWVCGVAIPWADTCSSGCPHSIFQLQESGQIPRAAGRADVGMKFFTPSWISVEQAFIVWLGDSLCAEDPCSIGQGVLCHCLMIQGAKGTHPGRSCCHSMPWCGAGTAPCPAAGVTTVPVVSLPPGKSKHGTAFLCLGNSQAVSKNTFWKDQLEHAGWCCLRAEQTVRGAGCLQPFILPFSQILPLKPGCFFLVEGTARILQLALPVAQAEECSVCRSLKVVLKNDDCKTHGDLQLTLNC